MAEIVISVENLGKKYRIKHEADRQRYIALRDVLADNAKGLVNRVGSAFRRAFSTHSASSDKSPSYEDFWALRNVNFNIKQGEVVGIIGRNGAGKSTLLKILSQITEPSEGRVRINGRVASLLEVGTGFHPELTGRENIFLNGAILGMSRLEISSKFDEIVEFAEIEKFIDTPVKRFSSGMYVRLAFAVAAHLEPEILIIDEVLAVGDQDFQKKCLGKISAAAKSGRTILFVSHSTAAVATLCSSAILLRKGSVAFCGATSQALEAYLGDATMMHSGQTDTKHHATRPKHLAPIIEAVEILQAGQPSFVLLAGHSIEVRLLLRMPGTVTSPRFAFAVEDMMARRIMTGASYLESFEPRSLHGQQTVRFDFNPGFLAPGRYLLSLSVADKYTGLLDSIDGAIAFDVEWGNGTGSDEPFESAFGIQVVRSNWKYIS